MASKKRNEWLDADQSEDEEGGYDSEIEEESRASRAVKRRRISRDEDEDSGFSSAGETEANDIESEDKKEDSNTEDPPLRSSSRFKSNDNMATPETSSKPFKTSKSKSKLRESLESNPLEPPRPPASKTGVIYISRVPPFMKPATVKRLLSPYGTVTRLFLTPEDPVARQQRLRTGGNKKRTFTDGWVEFARKRDAKLVAETLNANIIGGKKGGYYHDDVWNIRYLKGFKWHHLTEQIANENAERAARLRRDIAETRREDKRFVANVERAKMLEGMAKKKKERMQRDVDLDGSTGIVEAIDRDKGQRAKRYFKQNKVRTSNDRENSAAKQPEDVSRVLSKIF